MWLLDAIERLAPRLGGYPAWARMLFTSTFVAVLLSVALYAVQYSGATAEQQEAKVTAAITPTALTAAEAVNAAQLNPPTSDAVPPDPFKTELTYIERRERGKRHFVASQPYLDAIRSGGLVHARSGLTPEPWVEAKRPLALDLKITNNRSETVFIDEAVITVQRSTPDHAPVPVPMTLHDKPRELTIVNQGWGSAENLVLRFNLGRPGASTPSAGPPFKHAATQTGSLGTTAAFDLDRAFIEEGADVGVLRAFETTGAPRVLTSDLLQSLRRAASPFRLGSSADSAVPLAGRLEYTEQRSGRARTLRLRAQVPVTKPFGLGDFVPPSASYRAVVLAPEGAAYERRVALSQSVKPGAVDRFEIPLMVARSSRHRVQVRLTYNSGAILVGPIVLNMFVPRLG